MTSPLFRDMTANQVKALEYQERVRSDKEQEAIAHKQNELKRRDVERQSARDKWEQREKAKQNAIGMHSNLITQSHNSQMEMFEAHKTGQGWLKAIGSTIGGAIAGLFGGK